MRKSTEAPTSGRGGQQGQSGSPRCASKGAVQRQGEESPAWVDLQKIQKRGPMSMTRYVPCLGCVMKTGGDKTRACPVQTCGFPHPGSLLFLALSLPPSVPRCGSFSASPFAQSSPTSCPSLTSCHYPSHKVKSSIKSAPPESPPASNEQRGLGQR